MEPSGTKTSRLSGISLCSLFNYQRSTLLSDQVRTLAGYGYPHNGSHGCIGLDKDSATHLAHTYRVKAEITSPEAMNDLLPGMVCRVVISDREQKGYILSAGCIQTQQRGHSVWVLRNVRAERRMITIRDFVENGVLVSEGVELGDTVISKGYQKMFNGAIVEF